MPGGFRVGEIFGISINIDWSWIFIFLLVTWNLSFAVFPTLHPDWSFSLSLIIGVLASILFFASVLTHEIAHSLVARTQGLNVSQITLFLFGGVSNIEKEPPSPRAEFLIAIVGPLTSIALGALFLSLAGFNFSFGGGVSDPAAVLRNLGPLTTLLAWLGPINILLGFFNLIPGFPLDGGRVLRSIVWSISGNLRQSTYIAALAGQGIAWLFILGGVSMVFGLELPVLGSGLLGGIWLILIGFFLNSLAAGSYQQVVVKSSLEGVPVKKIMRKDVPVVDQNLSVSDLVYKNIIRGSERAFMVTKDSQILGIVTLEDTKKVPGERWEEVKVEQIMTPKGELEVITLEEDLSEAMEKLTKRDIGQIPIVKDDQLVGIISRRDIILWLQLQS